MKILSFLTVVNSQACIDESPNCDRLSVNCGNPVVDSLCRFTCGACDAPITTTPVYTTSYLGIILSKNCNL